MQVNPEEKERRQEALDRELCVTVIIARIAIDWRRTHAPRPYVCSEKNPTNGRRPFILLISHINSYMYMHMKEKERQSGLVRFCACVLSWVEIL